MKKSLFNNVLLVPPVSYIISIFMSSIFFVLGFGMLLFAVLGFITDMKFKDVTGIITNKDFRDTYYYSVSYNVENNNYVKDNLTSVHEYNVGDEVSLSYGKKDPSYVSFKNDNFGLTYYLVMILFLSSIVILINRVKKLLHFINPSKYPDVKDISYGMSIGNVSLTNRNILHDDLEKDNIDFYN